LVQFKPPGADGKFNLPATKSQFHFGSIQTMKKEKKHDIDIEGVSIPLWFNSNNGKR